jgi:hypothetical protein
LNVQYKTEILNLKDCIVGTSDLEALPCLKQKNPYKEIGDTYCYRVWHIKWLTEKVKAGELLDLPAGSVDQGKTVAENGPSVCRTQALNMFRPDKVGLFTE